MTALRGTLPPHMALIRFSHHLRLSNRPFSITRHASARTPITDRKRILEKPSKFNPPSHPARRVMKPRNFPGPRLTEKEVAERETKRYPNMMPPEGSFMHSFLTDRRVHLAITLSTLFALAFWSMSQSFLRTTIYRDKLPAWSDLPSHPFKTISQFWTIYKLHVAYESEKAAHKRRAKVEDAAKRQEFLREHGVEPGFLTGSWMDKFGTIEGDKWRAERAERAASNEEAQPIDSRLAGPLAMASGTVGVELPHHGDGGDQDTAQQEQPRRERKKVKMWFGIW